MNMPTRRDQEMDQGPGRFMLDPNNQRGRNKRNTDPYILDEGMPEPSVCTSCHAIYRNKRWYLKEQDYYTIKESDTVHETVCPACQKMDQLYPEGVVTLRGDYLWKHEEEILNILRNTENNAMAKNPLERIMSIKPEGDALVIETTEEKLAEHLGRALNKAYQGDLEIVWSDNHSLCRVNWERFE
jgi:NMD protein affecting ribosome stability and mRNA decay